MVTARLVHEDGNSHDPLEQGWRQGDARDEVNSALARACHVRSIAGIETPACRRKSVSASSPWRVTWRRPRRRRGSSS